jgi:hypothetical protein
MRIAHSPDVSDHGGERSFVGARRTYRGGDGVAWTVQEREAGRRPDGSARRSLIFENEGVLRRVYAYPPAWFELSDAELEALSWGR